MNWQRLSTILLSVLANGWSWFSYLLTGFPADKEVYRDHAWGWLNPNMDVPWAEYDANPGFHELKNVGVEYCRANAQPAMKSLCMFLMLGWIGCFIFALLSLLLFLV